MMLQKAMVVQKAMALRTRHSVSEKVWRSSTPTPVYIIDEGTMDMDISLIVVASGHRSELNDVVTRGGVLSIVSREGR
jgi:hypothetical protein